MMVDCSCRLGQILVFSKIRAALGIMSTIISGGGSLATHLDDFFEVCPMTEDVKQKSPFGIWVVCQHGSITPSMRMAFVLLGLSTFPMLVMPCVCTFNEQEHSACHVGLVLAGIEWLGPD